MLLAGGLDVVSWRFVVVASDIVQLDGVVVLRVLI